MKSKEEIEEQIGFKLEYIKKIIYIDGNDYNNFQWEVEEYITLTPESADRVKKLLIESLKNGDIETSNACEDILENAKINDIDLDDEFKSKRGKLQAQFLDKYIDELQSIDGESMDNSKIEEILENYQIISKFKNISNFEEEKQKLSDIIQSKIESRIQVLGEKISELKEHIEIPENEKALDELQQKIESIEEKYVDFKAKIEYSKQKINTSKENTLRAAFIKSEENIKDDLQKNIFNHKAERIKEQGIETSEIMQNISQYRAVNLKGRSSSNYYVIKFNELNGKVAKKTEYLEQKLAFLQEHKEIPGNAERILQVETELETMQDAWIVAQKGYNDIDGIIQTISSGITDNKKMVEQYKKELETMSTTSRNYLQQKDIIKNLTKKIEYDEYYITKIQQIGEEINNGTNPQFMGKHHRDRLQREEQERIETNRAKIQELDGQIVELQEHIEIPENEKKINELQAKIDEIEETIPSDRWKHRWARVQEQGRSTETILTDIDNIIKKYDNPYLLGDAKGIDAEIKTRVAYLENKKNYLQKHLDIKGNEERVAELQNQIEQLEDKWELCAQGFGSKEQIEQRIRIKEGHLYTILMSFITNEDLELTAEQMQEYWDKIQNGEEVPELFGQHHKERLEKEKEVRIKAEQRERVALEQKYGLVGIENKETLQKRLENIVSKGIFLGADKDNEKKVAEFEKMKQVIPKLEEFTEVYLQLRGKGIEDELYVNIDFQNVSFDDLLKRATIILEENEKTEEATKAEQEAKLNEVEEQEELKEAEKVEKPEEVKKSEEVKEPESEEVDQNAMMKEEFESLQKDIEELNSQGNENYEKENPLQTSKLVASPQHGKNIRPSEESPKDEIGDEFKKTEEQRQEINTQSTDLWMNRFSGWYSAIDRVSQKVKAKFVKMKSDIIKVIREKIKERSNKHEFNKNQDQNPKER